MSSNLFSGNTAGRLAKAVVLAGASLYGAFNCLFTVEGGHRGIVFNRLMGVRDETFLEGTHIIIPWFERPIIYDIRAKPNLINSSSGSKDLQMVSISLRVLTRPNPVKLPELYKTLGTDYAERVLPSIIQVINYHDFYIKTVYCIIYLGNFEKCYCPIHSSTIVDYA